MSFLVFVSLLILSGCAVNKQGNTTQFSLDAGELTARVVQELQTTSGGRAVLRRQPDGQYQIKLYDRNRVIDLGKMSAPFVDFIAKVNDYDLISVGDVTRTCNNIHKLVQVKGYEVYFWDVNNAAGSCSLPLEFAVDGQSWKISQQVSNADRQTWIWTAGRLATNTQRFSPVPGLANQRQTPNNTTITGGNNIRYQGPVKSNTSELDKKNPFAGAGFETNETDSQKGSRANVGADKKVDASGRTNSVSAVPVKNEPVAKTPRTPLTRIPEGAYTKPSPGSDTEVPPIRVQLKN